MRGLAKVMGEEGRLLRWALVSPGLRDLCETHRDLFAADLLIASDGPRLRADRPTVFLGSRGSMNFDLAIEARQGGHHSGNWGGLISNPGLQLAHAIATIAGPTGQIRIPEWVHEEMLKPHRAYCQFDGQEVEGLYRDSITLGLAPGGIVKVWVGGPCLSDIEITRYQASVSKVGPYGGKSGGKHRPLNEISRAYIERHGVPYGSW